jgi:hypothetical protein
MSCQVVFYLNIYPLINYNTPEKGEDALSGAHKWRRETPGRPPPPPRLFSSDAHTQKFRPTLQQKPLVSAPQFVHRTYIHTHSLFLPETAAEEIRGAHGSRPYWSVCPSAVLCPTTTLGSTPRCLSHTKSNGASNADIKWYTIHLTHLRARVAEINVQSNPLGVSCGRNGDFRHPLRRTQTKTSEVSFTNPPHWVGDKGRE